jgi:hypothetical protein
MAIGWIQKSHMPAGRKPFSEGPNVAQTPRQEIIRPHRAPDGHDVDGTLAANSAAKAPSRAEYLRDLRGTPYGGKDANRDPRASVNGPQNPAVHSKNTKRYGHNPTSGDIQGSTGHQPITQIERGPDLRKIVAKEKKPDGPKVYSVDYFGKQTPRK